MGGRGGVQGQSTLRSCTHPRAQPRWETPPPPTTEGTRPPGPACLPPLPPQAAAILGDSVLPHLPRADHLCGTLTPLWPQHLNGEGYLQGSAAAHYPHRLHPTLPQYPQGSLCDVRFLAQKEGLKSSDADQQGDFAFGGGFPTLSGEVCSRELHHCASWWPDGALPPILQMAPPSSKPGSCSFIQQVFPECVASARH